jgi:hypothetical protein
MAFLQAFLCSKITFFLKYQPSVDNRKVIGGVGLQTHPRSGFLELPMKTSLRGWHKTWFYCENHEPSLPPFIGRLPGYQGTWNEEPTPAELHLVPALFSRVNNLKARGLTRVYVATHWLVYRVTPLKKQIHPGWEYNGLQDPTRETTERIEPSKLVSG